MKKTLFALMGLAMLTLASCGGNKDAKTDTAAAPAEETVSPMDTSIAAPSEGDVVGMEVATPEDSGNGVIAGGVDEEKVEMR